MKPCAALGPDHLKSWIRIFELGGMRLSGIPAWLGLKPKEFRDSSSYHQLQHCTPHLDAPKRHVKCSHRVLFFPGCVALYEIDRGRWKPRQGWAASIVEAVRPSGRKLKGTEGLVDAEAEAESFGQGRSLHSCLPRMPYSPLLAVR